MRGRFRRAGSSRLTRSLSDRIRILYIKALLRQEMAWYDTQKTGKLIARVSGDVDLIQEGISKVSLGIQARRRNFVCLFISL